MPNRYYHSVTLDESKCMGCTNCLKRCPTEAIRIRGGRAHIIDELCIDCGECIRTCPYHAKVAVTNPLATINRFPYKIALPAPALYGQFKELASIGSVPRGLKRMGFDEVYEVARGADIVSCAVKARIKEPDCPKPLISSSCPAVVRLIQARFPELIDNIVDIRSPMEVAAMEARRDFCNKHGVAPKDVGCFFITPCAAKMTAIREPLGQKESAVDGAISILEIYGLLSGQIRHDDSGETNDEEDYHATRYGIGWARSGGEASAMAIDNALAVDGIENVSRVLEEIENDRLTDLVFFEGLACNGGCVGGPLVFENGYVAKTRIRRLMDRLPKVLPQQRVDEGHLNEVMPEIRFDKPIKPIQVMRLDSDIGQALQKINQIEEIKRRLPGLDCGSCGSPTCQALAEDIVKGEANEIDCLLVLKKRVRAMAQQMVELSDTTRE